MIEKKERKSIEDIFFDYDEDYFRMVEKAVIEWIALSSDEKAIYAAGGGAFQFDQNRKLMRQSGVVIYIKGSFELLWERLKNYEHRPLIFGRTIEEKRKRLEKLYEMRIENFDETHFTLDVDGKSPELCAQELFEMVVNSEKISLEE